MIYRVLTRSCDPKPLRVKMLAHVSSVCCVSCQPVTLQPLPNRICVSRSCAKRVALAEVAEYSVPFMQLMHHCPIMFDIWSLDNLKVYGQGISRYVQVFQTQHFPRPKESMNSAVCSQPLGRHSRFLGQKGDKGICARFLWSGQVWILEGNWPKQW